MRKNMIKCKEQERKSFYCSSLSFYSFNSFSSCSCSIFIVIRQSFLLHFHFYASPFCHCGKVLKEASRLMRTTRFTVNDMTRTMPWMQIQQHWGSDGCKDKLKSGINSTEQEGILKSTEVETHFLPRRKRIVFPSGMYCTLFDRRRRCEGRDDEKRKTLWIIQCLHICRLGARYVLLGLRGMLQFSIFRKLCW